MRVERRVIASTALAVVGFLAFVWFWTLDVHVEELNVDGVPAFCGSAYDVVLLKGDGYMGGEVPADQRAIDRACVRKAGRDLLFGGMAGFCGVAVAGYAVAQVTGRPSRRRGSGDASVILPGHDGPAAA